jgi:hypothetical protein
MEQNNLALLRLRSKRLQIGWIELSGTRKSRGGFSLDFQDDKKERLVMDV